MKLTASKWKRFTDDFPRDMTSQCENNWDEYREKLGELSALTTDLVSGEFEIDVQLEGGVTPEAYKMQCIKEASHFLSQAAWATHYKGKASLYPEARTYLSSAFAFAALLEPNSPDQHEVLAHAKYVRAALVVGNCKGDDEKKLEAYRYMKEAFAHMQAISDRIDAETWVQALNQLARCLRYVTDRMLEACDIFDDAERIVLDELSKKAPLTPTKAITLDMMIRGAEGPAIPRHDDNRNTTRAKAGLPMKQIDEEAYNNPEYTPWYQAYLRTRRAEQLIALAKQQEKDHDDAPYPLVTSDVYAKAYQLAETAYEVQQATKTNSLEHTLASLAVLVEAGIKLNKPIATYCVAARALLLELNPSIHHAVANTLRALEPQMNAIIAASRASGSASPVTTGLGLTAELERSNTAMLEQGTRHDEVFNAGL